MSNYNPLTNFTAKDSLTTGDPQKIIRGADFDAEFDSISTAVNSKADANNAALTGSSSAVNLDITGTFELGGTAVTATATELNILDGVTSTTAELNLLDGVTASTAELNILDGVTASTAELNLLDGVTATTAELNLLDGVTASTAELNLLDGVTASTAELNLLDGVTATTAELNQLDGNVFTADLTIPDKIIHAGDTNTAIRFPAADTVTVETAGTERVRVDSSGNVGIGTTSPAYELDVDGTIRTTDDIYLTNGSASQVRFADSTDTNGYTFRANVSNVADFGLFIEKLDGTDLYNIGRDDPHIWYSATGVERMRIDSSGNVGIGTSSPSSTLTVSDGTSSGLSPFAGTALFLDSSGSNYLQFGSGASSPAAIYFGDSADGDVGGIIYSHSSNYMSFRANASERMRIDSSGNVGIGTTSPATPLHVDGTIRYTNRPAAGTITALGFDANGDLKASSSSLRYKHDIQDYGKGLAEVMQLRPVSFKFNGEETINIGFIAEEVHALGMTEVMLYDDEDRPEGIQYANMVSLLTKAIQEQQNIIEQLTARVAELESKV